MHYKDLKILFNNRSELGLELDIFIKELNLAFEINGVFHYKPIYGYEKFSQMMKNDDKKLRLCNERNINLIIINSTKQNKFSEESSEMFFKEICSHIDAKLMAGSPSNDLGITVLETVVLPITL